MTPLKDKIDNETLDLKTKIGGFANLPKNWDGLGTSAPTALAIDNALCILKELLNKGITPDSVNPTSDESIIIQLYKSGDFYLFECFNDGDIVFLKKQNGEREVIDLQMQATLLKMPQQ